MLPSLRQKGESASWRAEQHSCCVGGTEGDKDKERENQAQEAVTAGKDTADLICLEQTSSLQLNAIYKQRAKDDMHTQTHTHSLSPCPRKDRDTHFPVTPAGSQPCFSSRFAGNKNKNTSGSGMLTFEGLSGGVWMLAGQSHAELVMEINS